MESLTTCQTLTVGLGRFEKSFVYVLFAIIATVGNVVCKFCGCGGLTVTGTTPKKRKTIYL